MKIVPFVSPSSKYNMDNPPPQYQNTEVINLRFLDKEGDIVWGGSITSKEGLDELISQYPLSHFRIFYEVKGAVRARYLWLWGADWPSNIPRIFELLTERLLGNLLCEWRAELWCPYKNDVLTSYVACDELTYPEKYSAPRSRRLQMAVRNGEKSYQAYEKRQQEVLLAHHPTIDELGGIEALHEKRKALYDEWVRSNKKTE